MARELTGRLDPQRSHFVFVTGKKGSGKSVLARRLWASYPYDRLVIDPTGDADAGDDVTDLADPLPTRWPTPINDERVSLRYVPDPGAADYLDNLDRAIGLAFYHPDKRCLLWIDEIAEVTRANKTPPHFRRALHQGRHRGLSMLMCGPRPIDVNPLCISQADFVYVFRLPNPADRQRVALEIGWEPKDFDEAVLNLKRYEYLRYDANAEDEDDELDHYPPLPVAARRAR